MLGILALTIYLMLDIVAVANDLEQSSQETA